MFDVAGKEVRIIKSINQQSYKLNLEDLSKGLYTLQVQIENSSITKIVLIINIIIMKFKNILNFSLITILMSSCLGDKKAANVAEMNDNSFINENFRENGISYSKDMSACEIMSASDIASLYNVSESMIVFEDISKSDRRVPNSAPTCMFYLKDGASDFEWLRGSMNVQREIGKNETAYDIAKAAGNGEEWEEAWALNKSISKSSEWIENIGMAALWNDKKKELKIKFKGYTLNVYPLKNRLNKAEVSKNRDYKSIAIAMAKAAGFIK